MKRTFTLSSLIASALLITACPSINAKQHAPKGSTQTDEPNGYVTPHGGYHTDGGDDCPPDETCGSTDDAGVPDGGQNFPERQPNPETDAGPQGHAGHGGQGGSGGAPSDAGMPDGGQPAPTTLPAPVTPTMGECTCGLDFSTFYFSGHPVAGQPLYLELLDSPLAGAGVLPIVPESATKTILVQDTVTSLANVTYCVEHAGAAVGTHEINLLSYLSLADAESGSPDNGFAWWDSLTNMHNMSAAARAYLYCDSWNAATQTWTALADNHCRVRVTLTADENTCVFTPAGNLGNYVCATATFIGAESPCAVDEQPDGGQNFPE